MEDEAVVKETAAEKEKRLAVKAEGTIFLEVVSTICLNYGLRLTCLASPDEHEQDLYTIHNGAYAPSPIVVSFVWKNRTISIVGPTSEPFKVKTPLSPNGFRKRLKMFGLVQKAFEALGKVNFNCKPYSTRAAFDVKKGKVSLTFDV